MTKRERALSLTSEQLTVVRKNGGLPAVAQALGQSGRGTEEELLARIKKSQKQHHYKLQYGGR